MRPDGAVRWIWDRGFPIHDATDHVYRIAGLAEDITTRKLAEDQLRRQQVELAKMSRLSLAVELASNLAHELNQPLAAIVAYTQACLTLLRGHRRPRELTGTLEEVVNQGCEPAASSATCAGWCRNTRPLRPKSISMF